MMTQKEFAERVGCHPTAVGRWVDGSRTPDVRFIDGVARVLGITVDEVLALRRAGQLNQTIIDFLRSDDDELDAVSA